MKKRTLFLIVLAACFFLTNIFSVYAHEPCAGEKSAISAEAQAWQVLATSPGVKVLSQVTHNPGQILEKGENPLETAQDWLADKDLEEGRNLKSKKLLYISIGAATVNARPEDPGFIDSRFLAFQRAELEAKAKTAIFLGADLTTSRGASEREINPEERAALQDIVNASPELKKTTRTMNIAGSISELFEKSKTLISAKLDKAIREDKAYEKAGKKARLRALASMRTFMGEKVAFMASEELAEALALYAGEYKEGEGSQEYKSISQFQEKTHGIKDNGMVSVIPENGKRY